MKVTPELIKFLHSEQKKRNLSYAEMGRMAEPVWQAWQQLFQNRTYELSDKMVCAICQIFGVNKVELMEIANGVSAPDLDRHDYLALWLRYEATPSAINAVYSTAELGGFKAPSSEDGTPPPPKKTKKE